MFGDEMRIGLDHVAVEALDSNAVAARRRGERGGETTYASGSLSSVCAQAASNKARDATASAA
jgi:hypothetical protein